MPDNGYVSIWRRLFHSDLWLCEKFTRGQAWIDLIGLANHKKKTFHIRGIPITVERGQLAWSVLNLSNRWNWSKKKTMRVLAEWIEEKMIHTKSTNVTTVITIINYDSWQTYDTPKDTPKQAQMTHQMHTKRNTNNNDNNDNNDNKKNISFEKLWKLYPNKDGKKEALRHFTATVKNDQDQQDIEKALNNYLSHLKAETWKKPKNGSTWFNNWRDWVEWKAYVDPETTIIDTGKIREKKEAIARLRDLDEKYYANDIVTLEEDIKRLEGRYKS